MRLGTLTLAGLMIVLPSCGARTLLDVGAAAGSGVDGDSGIANNGGGGSSGSGGGGIGGSSSGGVGGSTSGSTGGVGSSGSTGGVGSGGSGMPLPPTPGGRSRDAGSPTRINDCPNCPGAQVCCLTPVGGRLVGTCAATPMACPQTAGVITCTAQMDCPGAQMCCLTLDTTGGSATTSCQNACPAGSPPACGGMPMDNVDCPGGSSGWRCVPIPGTPRAVAGMCVPAQTPRPPVVDSGGAPETGSPDGEAGVLPSDAAADGD
jgi:hypothetical protein